MPPQTPKQPELSNTTIGLMVAVALFYDALQWLLGWIFMGWLIIPIFYLTFIVWFKLKGLSFLTLKNAGGQAVGAILEFASAGIIPAFTLIVAVAALGPKIRKFGGI